MVVFLNVLTIGMCLLLAGCGQLGLDIIGALPPMKISNSSQNDSLVVNDIVTLVPEGGKKPYTYTIEKGNGSIDPVTGQFIAPNEAGESHIIVKDAAGNTLTYVIKIEPALSISSPVSTISSVNVVKFSSSGGVGPYEFSVSSGPGVVDSNTGLYDPQGNTGTAVVQLRDSLNHVVQKTLLIRPPLRISPEDSSMFTSTVSSFYGMDGVPPYTYSVLAGSGSIGFSNGLYQAATTPGLAMIQVVDALGNMATTQVTVNQNVQLTPAGATIAVGNRQSFKATNGAAPYQFSIVSGPATIVATSSDEIEVEGLGVGTALIKVEDGNGNFTQVSLVVNPSIMINPAAKTLAVNNQFVFSATGGVGVYNYSCLHGSIDPLSGEYTAPTGAGVDTVTVKDALGNASSSMVTINPSLQISPTSAQTGIGKSLSFSATGGVAPYSYSVVSGGGSFSGSVYTAGPAPETVIVKVTDSIGNSSQTFITVHDKPSLSPSAVTLAINNSVTYSVSGGVSPYSYSVVSGAGSFSGTAFTASTTPGAVVVKVTDAVGNFSFANIAVNPALSISPATKVLAVNNSFTFSAAGGVAPYVYSTTGGAIDPDTGVFTAPGSAGAITVKVTDALGNIATSSVTVNPALSANSSSVTIANNNTFTFSGVNGAAPYTYTLISGVGSIHSSSGVYDPSGQTGTAVVAVTDSAGNTVTIPVTVNAALGISVDKPSITVSNAAQFLASGGVPPYTYSISSGAGSVDLNGLYTPSSAGSATVKVTDAFGNQASLSLSVNGALQISPATVTVTINATQNFSATGGVPPLVYSIQSGGGSINSSTGVYAAPATAQAVTVKVVDALLNVSTSTVAVQDWQLLTISSNTLHYNVATAVGNPSSPVNVQVTINSGVYVYSDNTSIAAFDTGNLPSGSQVKIINNGYILGRGGNGGGCNGASKTPGENGGPAIVLRVPASIDNTNGGIGGGGGGGGASYRTSGSKECFSGGGGAGGGSGGIGVDENGVAYGIAMGGGPGQIGGVPSNWLWSDFGGALWAWEAFGSGGGRIFPGVSVSVPSYGNRNNVGGQAGGPGGIVQSGMLPANTGSSGGGGANPGGVSACASDYAGVGAGGGGWGAKGGNACAGLYFAITTSGNGGPAVNTQGNSLTWLGGNDASRVMGAVN